MSEVPLPDTDLAAARGGDDAAFTRLVQPLRGELHAHCYRMPGSTHGEPTADLTEGRRRRVREIVAEYAGALERGDADALLALLTEGVTWSMPPMTEWHTGWSP